MVLLRFVYSDAKKYLVYVFIVCRVKVEPKRLHFPVSGALWHCKTSLCFDGNRKHLLVLRILSHVKRGQSAHIQSFGLSGSQEKGLYARKLPQKRLRAKL